jgi:hypothetical protein
MFFSQYLALAGFHGQYPSTSVGVLSPNSEAFVLISFGIAERIRQFRVLSATAPFS